MPFRDEDTWICLFEVSDLCISSVTPPTFISNDLKIVAQDGQKPMLWADLQDEGGNAASSAAINSHNQSHDVGNQRVSYSRHLRSPQSTPLPPQQHRLRSLLLPHFPPLQKPALSLQHPRSHQPLLPLQAHQVVLARAKRSRQTRLYHGRTAISRQNERSTLRPTH